MEYTWNLDPLYHGFDDPRYAADLDTLRAQVEKLTALPEKLPGMAPTEGLKAGIAILEQMEELTSKLFLYAELRQSVNTRDPEPGSKIGQIMTVYSAAAAPRAAFQAWIAKLDLTEALADPQLKDYAFLLTRTQENSKYLLAGDGEAVAARFGISGGSAWSEMQQYLTSTVKVNYRGTVTNLSSIRNMA